MKDLTPQERAAVIIRTLVNSTGLSMQALNLQSDLAISKMSENEQERLQQMVSSILYENIAAPSSEKGYSEKGNYRPMTEEETPRMTSIEPNLDGGMGNGLTTGPPPGSASAMHENKMIKQSQFNDFLQQFQNNLQSLVQMFPQLRQLETLQNVDLSELEELNNVLPEIQNLLDKLPEIQQVFGEGMLAAPTAQKLEGGNKRMAQKESYEELEKELFKEALKADAKGETELLNEIQATMIYNNILSKKAKAKELENELLKADLKNDNKKVAQLEEKLAEVEDGIKYLERDWEAFKKFDMFPEQEEGVTTMGYAKPDYNMGEEHTVNPTNVLDPEGKIPDMEQFPSGDDKRVDDFKKAKPAVPMASTPKDSSISKTTEGIETVKVLDEKDDIHQKEQPAVPDSLPKLAQSKKMSKEAQVQLAALIRYLPVILEALPVLIENADDIEQLLNQFGANVNLSGIVPQLQQLSNFLPQLQEMSQQFASKGSYIIKVAGKYEDVPKDEIVFPPTEDDEDGHFPIDTEKRARAALTYVNQYDSVPKWAKDRGVDSLEALVKKVANAVEKKYPDIEVSEEAKEPGGEKEAKKNTK
jgi:hypothetical protein